MDRVFLQRGTTAFHRHKNELILIQYSLTFWPTWTILHLSIAERERICAVLD